MKAADFHALYPWPQNDGKRPYVETYFTVDLPVSRAEIWPYVVDTSRFYRALGMGRRYEREVNGKLLMRESLHGIAIEWIEQPWTWLFESHAIAERDFLRGPFSKFRAVLHLIDNPAGGVTVCVCFQWVVKSRIFGQLLRLALLKVRNDVRKIFARLAESILAKRMETDANPYLVRKPITDPAALRRFEKISAELLGADVNREAVTSLLDHVRCGDEIDLFRLRPLVLARAWNVDDREVMRACLLATRLGLLKVSWDVTCPHCRGTREEATSLAGIPKRGRCEVCDIDFSTAGENAVEVTFRVHDSIRPSEKVLFCAAEPAKKPHIKWQRQLNAGEKASALFQLRPGIYRLRELVSKAESVVEIVTGDAPSELTWALEAAAPPEPPKLAGRCALTVRNDTPRPASFVLEELWWERDILRPGRLFCLPEFQKLFSREALAAGVQLDLGNQTIFFSDIVGSTRFYQEVGDSAAFAAVVAHFDELTGILVRNGGAIIKTIGDAVMASFHNPEDCLRACEEVQRAFSGGSSRQKVRLRISAHYGPVIAVNWNTGRDYFGHVVNFAAKMQACAGAGEVAVSPELLEQVHGLAPFKRLPSRTEPLTVAGQSGPASITVFAVSAEAETLRRAA